MALIKYQLAKVPQWPPKALHIMSSKIMASEEKMHTNIDTKAFKDWLSLFLGAGVFLQEKFKEGPALGPLSV